MVRKLGIFMGIALGLFAMALAVTFSVSVSAATFSLGNPNSSLNTIYGPSQNITGWINISLNNANSDSSINDNYGSAISLIDLLQKNNKTYSYTCSPSDCSGSYAATKGSVSDQFFLKGGESKIVGLNFSGDISQIDSASMTIKSNASASCLDQLKIDILDNNQTNFENSNAASVSTGCTNFKSYGCWNSKESTTEYVIRTTPYCEEIKLNESPGFTVGAWVQKVSGLETVKATLYQGGLPLKSCNLPDASSAGGEISCNINYSTSEPGTYYVCISTNSSSTSNNYRIRADVNPITKCGFFGTPTSNPVENEAYQIFAQGQMFAPVGTINIPNRFKDGEVFSSMIQNYITNRYGGLNCTSGCVVPIRLISNANQEITINNVSVEYETSGGIVPDNNIYDVTETPAKISAKSQPLYLDGAGLLTPGSFGNSTLILYMDSSEILSKQLQIKNVPTVISLIPRVTAFGFPITFLATINSSNPINSVTWYFNDSSYPSLTYNGSVTHTFSKAGNYTVTVSPTDTSGLSSNATFNIEVNSPEQLIKNKLSQLQNNINNVATQMTSFDPFTKNVINIALNTTYIQKQINSINSSFQSSPNYTTIIPEISLLNYPELITQGDNATGITFIPDQNSIIPSELQSVGDGYNSSLDSNYANAILLWENDNLGTTLNYVEYYGIYTNSQNVVTRVFTLDFNNKNSTNVNYYLFMPALDNLRFNSGVDAKYSSDKSYVYVPINGMSSISFSTTSDVDFSNLPAFVSPAISDLNVQIITPAPPLKSKITALILALIVLGVIAIVVYISMQEWYKRKYEGHLFRNRNDLFNMVNYVNSSKKRGLSNSEIEKNLKKAGWSGEQITYVMKKYAGKRTGMLEIPIDKLLSDIGLGNKDKQNNR